MIIGIDLGTSTSEVSIIRNGKPELIRDVRGSNRGILPSVVGINSAGRIVVGDDMVAQLVLKPDMAVQEVKRQMGKSVEISVGGEKYSPPEIAAFILRHLKDEAERYVGEPVREAVVTVPAYFTDRQRRATEDAAEMAGLKVCRLINEPTAAALAYGIERPHAEEIVAVYDLGGGTLDVTILELSEGILDVMASVGNSRLGGKDFDERLMSYVATECRRQTGFELLSTPRGRQRLKSECKRAKERLSSDVETTITLDNLGVGPDNQPIDFEITVTRAKFESLIEPLVTSTTAQIREALAVKNISPPQVKTVLMIGGSTRIPLVQKTVSNFFGGRPLRADVNPDEAVSLGAAVMAGIVEDTVGSDAAVITDVSPFTLGIAVMRDVNGQDIPGFFDPLIIKQSTVPRSAKKMYATSRDWQESVHVEVYQGDADRCDENEFVGDFHHPMERAPKGSSVEIEFSYNLNGLVTIVARDPRTGKETTHEVSPDRLRQPRTARKAAATKLDARWKHGSAAPTVAQPEAKPASEPNTAANADWTRSPLYKRVEALITFAKKQQADEKIRKQIDAHLASMKQAIEKGDVGKLEKAESALTDLLFEIG